MFYPFDECVAVEPSDREAFLADFVIEGGEGSDHSTWSKAITVGVTEEKAREIRDSLDAILD